MKKSELIFNLFSIPIDAVMLLLAGISSFYFRQNPDIIAKPIIYQLQLADLVLTVLKIIPALLAIFAFLGLYNLRGTRKFWSEFGRVAVGISLGLLVVILLFFFDQTLFPSRFIILATWILGITYVMLGRLALKIFQAILFSLGFGLHRLAIINGYGPATFLIEQEYKNSGLGYLVAAELKFDAGIFQRLEELAAKKSIDEILQANPDLSDEANLRLVEFSRNRGLQFSFVPNLFNVQRNAVETYSLRGVPVISLKNTPLDGWGRLIKRIFDIFASLVCLIAALPLFLFIGLAIKLDSRGKIIYSAMRGGKNRDFKFYKFRTMFSHLSVGEEYGGEQAERVRRELWKKNNRGGEDGPFLKIKQDPRVTRVGRFLRKTKLDELPQFWNVFKGHMSMVGPRAHVLDEVGRYRNRYRRMFSIKPGTFGVSQIAQISWPDLPFEEEIRLNTFYIENWSLWLDVKILAKSFWLLFFGVKSKEDY